jgi:hypothetical protein
MSEPLSDDRLADIRQRAAALNIPTRRAAILRELGRVDGDRGELLAEVDRLRGIIRDACADLTDLGLTPLIAAEHAVSHLRQCTAIWDGHSHTPAAEPQQLPVDEPAGDCEHPTAELVIGVADGAVTVTCGLCGSTPPDTTSDEPGAVETP